MRPVIKKETSASFEQSKVPFTSVLSIFAIPFKRIDITPNTIDTCNMIIFPFCFSYLLSFFSDLVVRPAQYSVRVFSPQVLKYIQFLQGYCVCFLFFIYFLPFSIHQERVRLILLLLLPFSKLPHIPFWIFSFGQARRPFLV